MKRMFHLTTTTLVMMTMLFLVGSALAGESGATGAQLNGTVTDPKGAVVVNAKVLLHGDATGYSQSAVTNQNGEYKFLLVPPGQYTVTVEAPGFAKLVNHGVVLTIGQVATLPLGMQIAAANEEITVSTAAE